MNDLTIKIPRVFHANHARDEAAAGLAREAEYALRVWAHYVRSLLSAKDLDAWASASVWRDVREGSGKSYWEFKLQARTPRGAPEAALPMWRLTRSDPPRVSEHQLATAWAAYVIVGVEQPDGSFDRIPLHQRLRELEVEFGITEQRYWTLLQEVRALVAGEIARGRGERAP